ncbi:MAG: hypothetical protein OJF58_002223 [Enhydrobacter sp.]|jgi:aspartate racemase|nr:MAG: hypothetical protein OJF58_002223 [Enhydrobacter sp.]
MPTREMSRNMANGDPARQAEIFERLVRRLKAAGAAAAAITSMGGHFCVRELEAISPLPILDAIPGIDAALGRLGVKRLGILGTRTVMESRLYGGVRAAEIVAPAGEAMEEVHSAYVEMANAGRVTERQRHIFFRAGHELRRQHDVEAILLGGTDLFLAFAGETPGFRVIDCAELHVDAIFARSTAA